MKVEFKKKGNKLFLNMIVIPKTVREPRRRYTTEDIELWLASNKKNIVLDNYRLIAKPHFVHDGMGESYLSGEWIYELIEQEAPTETPPVIITTKTTKTKTKRAPRQTKAILEAHTSSPSKSPSGKSASKKASKAKKVQRV